MRLICAEFSDPHWIDVIERVAASTNAVPVYWTGVGALEADVKQRFPGVVFHVTSDAVRGIPAPGFADRRLAPLDAGVLGQLAAHEPICLKMMERLDGDRRSFSYEERVRHYYRLVQYWLTVIQQLHPDAVLMPTAPHLVFDYVLYALCRALDVPLVVFERTSIPGRLLVLDRIEGGGPALRNAYQSQLAHGEGDVTLPADIESHLQRLRGSHAEGVAPNLKLSQEPSKAMEKAGGPQAGAGALPALRAMRSEAMALGYHLYKQGLEAPHSYLKLRHRPPERSRPGLFRLTVMRWLGMLEKARLRRLYGRIQTMPDLRRPYVFVALHYQPERDTVPIGGYFADQALLVELVARCLPPGWHVYVKEHGWQLQPYSRGQLARDRQFYEDIAALPNVSFVPTEVPSFDLIDGARAVATVAGSVGWEAVNRGKPALVFGEAWYKDCAGVHHVRTREDCQAALEQVNAGQPVSATDVRRFVAALEEVAVRAVLEPTREHRGGLSPEQIDENLAAAITARLMRIIPDEAPVERLSAG